MKIQAFTFDKSTFALKVLDQTRLPLELKYRDIEDAQAAFNAIREMLVRGAPCIAAVGCLSIVSELNNKLDLSKVTSTEKLIHWLKEKADYLSSSRPTAVNLRHALDKLVSFASNRTNSDKDQVVAELTQLCIKALDAGLVANRNLSEHGANRLLWVSEPRKLSILTHCNTGALATVGHGTALGVIRTLHEFGKLEKAYCTETRPYNQGSRLTAWELVQEKIPATLIADDMVAYLMKTHDIDAVVVGADRVAANGDTANKIGTLQIAVIAKHFKVPFYVAAPTQTIDLSTGNADAIVIEQRPPDELRKIGNYQLAPDDIDIWNPCFDVTPASLIDGIITEYGVCDTSELVNFLSRFESSDRGDAIF
jgi:methylthioribose-1-phosphate isomerase